MCVCCKLHVSRHAAWRSSDWGRVKHAAQPCLILQATHFNKLYRRVSGRVHTDKSAVRGWPNLSYHETLPGGLGLVAEESKVQQPCICADLQCSLRCPHLHLCLYQQTLPRGQPAGHSMLCSTSPGDHHSCWALHHAAVCTGCTSWRSLVSSHNSCWMSHSPSNCELPSAGAACRQGAQPACLVSLGCEVTSWECPAAICAGCCLQELVTNRELLVSRNCRRCELLSAGAASC